MLERLTDWVRCQWAYRVRGWATFIDGKGTVRWTYSVSKDELLSIPVEHWLRMQSDGIGV